MVHVLLSIFKPVGSVGLTMQLVAEVIGEEYAAFEPPFESNKHLNLLEHFCQIVSPSRFSAV